MTNTDWGFFVDIESKEIFPPEEMVVFTVEYSKTSIKNLDQIQHQTQSNFPSKSPSLITSTVAINKQMCQFIILFTIFIIAKFGCIKP